VLPFIGLPTPWLADYFFVLVGLVGFYSFFRMLYLLVASATRKTDLTPYGRGSWALVTGSTDGIGKAFAESLASQGFNIYMISRNPQKLKEVASAISEKYRVTVHSRAWDFSNCASKFDDLVEIIDSDIESKDISILVNNVGVFHFGSFHQLSVKEIADYISVNAMTITYMTRLVLTKLKSREGKSAMINLSSLSSLMVLPGASMYSATKKFDSAFTKLARQQLKSSNVVVMNLRPGFVPTNLVNGFLGDSVGSKSFLDNYLHFGVTAKECVEGALSDLGLSESFVGSLKHKLQGILRANAPECILAHFIKWMFLKKNKALEEKKRSGSS